jgi:hypothetical protein
VAFAGAIASLVCQRRDSGWLGARLQAAGLVSLPPWSVASELGGRVGSQASRC